MANLKDLVDDIMRRVDASPEQAFLRETLRRRLADELAPAQPATPSSEAVARTIRAIVRARSSVDWASRTHNWIGRVEEAADAILAEHIAPLTAQVEALTAERDAAQRMVALAEGAPWTKSEFAKDTTLLDAVFALCGAARQSTRSESGDAFVLEHLAHTVAKIQAKDADLTAAKAEIEGLRAALKQIADASPEPDDKQWYCPTWNDPSDYRFIGSDGAVHETGVDQGNADDMDSFGYARGLHAAALIARAALTSEHDHAR